MPESLLCRSCNLHILRRYIADESVDLVYFEPPLLQTPGEGVTR